MNALDEPGTGTITSITIGCPIGDPNPVCAQTATFVGHESSPVFAYGVMAFFIFDIAIGASILFVVLSPIFARLKLSMPHWRTRNE